MVEEVEMITEAKHDARQDETVRGRRERKRHEKALDEALRILFPRPPQSRSNSLC